MHNEVLYLTYTNEKDLAMASCQVEGQIVLYSWSDQKKYLLYAQPTPLAICTGYVYMCMYVCVAHRYVVKTPTVPPSHLLLTICQSFLLSNTNQTHYTFTNTHTFTHLSETNMT